MSFFMTEDQKLIVQSVHEFCTSASTQAMAAEEKKAGTFPRKYWKAAAEQGYIGAYLPEEYGGGGYDLTTFFLIAEEMMKCGAPIMGALAGQYLGSLAILYWGDDDVKKRYLPGVCSGDIVLCGAMTDPSGMGNFAEWNFTQEQVDGGWKVFCNKVMVTNAENCDVAVVFGPPAKGHHLPTVAYVVDKSLEGVEIGAQEPKILGGYSDWCGLTLNNVVVPESNRLTGDKINYVGTSFLFLAMEAMVTGYGAFKSAMEYCTTRTRYGKPLTALQSVSHHIADMVIANEASRAIIYTATRLWDEGREEECYRMCLIAKAFVTEHAGKSLHDAAVLHGGAGYAAKTGIGYMWINSLCMEIAEMPPDVHRDWIMETYGIQPGWKDGQD